MPGQLEGRGDGGADGIERFRDHRVRAPTRRGGHRLVERCLQPDPAEDLADDFRGGLHDVQPGAPLRFEGEFQRHGPGGKGIRTGQLVRQRVGHPGTGEDAHLVPLRKGGARQRQHREQMSERGSDREEQTHSSSEKGCSPGSVRAHPWWARTGGTGLSGRVGQLPWGPGALEPE
ncbi:hypothetical protein IU436_26925 [Nocardia farcinica]|nr:hypothetical protein [Nocardia farcinica]MBF6259399.1 hypothetical protein [Nocardia farcinica]MBF6376787.1 hypothetical protein [Nocardia farcinica]MBF6422302.1 hypothetical protein [Nocardia farcinica]MBF6433978.1 hypothetical protein [Nocardia farcinica]